MPGARGVEIRKFVRFLAVGGMGFVADAIVFFTLTLLMHSGLFTARVEASLLALTGTWLLNRRFTFSYQHVSRSFVEYLRYLAASSMGVAGNLLTMWLLTDLDGSNGRVQSYIAGAAAGLCINFLLYDKWVFRSPQRAL